MNADLPVSKESGARLTGMSQKHAYLRRCFNMYLEAWDGLPRGECSVDRSMACGEICDAFAFAGDVEDPSINYAIAMSALTHYDPGVVEAWVKRAPVADLVLLIEQYRDHFFVDNAGRPDDGEPDANDIRLWAILEDEIASRD